MVFERFDDEARHAVVVAQEEARRLRQHLIGTEHLLLALIRDQKGVAARALSHLGVGTDALRRRIESINEGGTDAPFAHIPMDRSMMRAVKLALKAPSARGDGRVGPAELLLGLIREGRGVGARALKEVGVDHRGARAALVEVLEEADRP